MSNATIVSPLATSQLFFDWSEQAEVGIAPPPPVRPKSAPRQVEPRQVTAARPSESAVPTAAATEATSQPAHCVAANSGHLTFTPDGRIARPVRMGTLMIKLLKRYGITDAEIAEGVANYARKHQTAMAS